MLTCGFSNQLSPDTLSCEAFSPKKILKGFSLMVLKVWNQLFKNGYEEKQPSILINNTCSNSPAELTPHNQREKQAHPTTVWPTSSIPVLFPTLSHQLTERGLSLELLAFLPVGWATQPCLLATVHAVVLASMFVRQQGPCLISMWHN